jgi:predicted dehydrogenase
MDDDLVARSAFRHWRSVSGAPWPYEDEFEVGVTLEHAGYSLGALMALFGPVQRVVASAALLYPGKPVAAGGHEGQDYSLAALQFESGVQARVTCSNVAPRDHGVTVIGETGVLQARDCWRYDSPVTVRRTLRIRNRTLLSPWREAVRLHPCGPKVKRRGAGAMDFARGPAELAHAIAQGRPSMMPLDFAMHVNEVSLAIHNSFAGGPAEHRPATRFEPLPPLPAPVI